LPEASREAWVEFLLPPGATGETPVVLHFAATGDEGFKRRRTFFALPLLRRGIGSLLLENPYYGRRRPPDQQGKMLNRFSDLWIMGASALAEGRALLVWLRRQGFRRLGVCGISMGGSLAAQTAALTTGEVAVAAGIAPHSAAVVFTEGLLKDYCDWAVLEAERDGATGAVELVRLVLERTDVRQYPPPACARAVRLVGARRDAYIPPWSVEALHRHWPGSQLHWIDTGHVGAFLFHRDAFLQAIDESLRALP
jgi:pimeloyl-ACP methyl ester carboxylesterase